MEYLGSAWPAPGSGRGGGTATDNGWTLLLLIVLLSASSFYAPSHFSFIITSIESPESVNSVPTLGDMEEGSGRAPLFRKSIVRSISRKFIAVVEIEKKTEWNFNAILISIAPSPAHACEMDQTHYGCRIDNGLCTCAYGCRSEFRYKTKRECQDSLKGRSSNVCFTSPCQHGSCTQISQMPGYKCRCEGTGYHGNRCQIRCPVPGDRVDNYPVECIIIWGQGWFFYPRILTLG